MDRVPTYRRHKPTGQAVVTVPIGNGKRKDVYLGVWKSPESKAEYIRIVGELQSGRSPITATGGKAPADITVAEAMVPYLDFCDDYYRHPNGEPTGHATTARLALRPLAERYGHTSMKDFGPLALRSIQQYWIDKGTTRLAINKYILIVRRFFKWAVSEEMIPSGTLEALRSLSGLRQGRSKAKEGEPVRPADEAILEKALRFMPETVAALVQLQQLCGARGGELLTLKAEQIDRTGEVWIYTPRSHKTAYRGKQRHIYFGPQAQEILLQWLSKAPADEYLFSPTRSEAARLAEVSAKRVTPRYPSHMNRNKAKRKKHRRRKPAEHYSPESYNRAVARACEKAFPLPEHLERRKEESAEAWKDRLGPTGLAEVKRWRDKHSFSPHQLRHLAATRIRKEHGIEMSRILLGHSTAFTTEIYAETDQEKAKAVAGRIADEQR